MAAVLRDHDLVKTIHSLMEIQLSCSMWLSCRGGQVENITQNVRCVRQLMAPVHSGIRDLICQLMKVFVYSDLQRVLSRSSRRLVEFRCSNGALEGNGRAVAAS